MATANATTPAKKTTLKTLADIVKEEAAKLDKDALANVDPETFRSGIAKLLATPTTSEPGDQRKSTPGMVSETILTPLDLGETILAAMDGTMTIAQAKDVFTGYLDSNFNAWGTDKPSTPTEPQATTVYELLKDATLKQMFGSISGNRDALCLTQAQIIRFCIDHRDKLLQTGYANLFLFKVDDEYFVARVNVTVRGLEACVNRFDYPLVWDAAHRVRVVVPQLQV